MRAWVVFRLLPSSTNSFIMLRTQNPLSTLRKSYFSKDTLSTLVFCKNDRAVCEIPTNRASTNRKRGNSGAGAHRLVCKLLKSGVGSVSLLSENDSPNKPTRTTALPWPSQASTAKAGQTFRHDRTTWQAVKHHVLVRKQRKEEEKAGVAKPQ